MSQSHKKSDSIHPPTDRTPIGHQATEADITEIFAKEDPTRVSTTAAIYQDYAPGEFSSGVSNPSDTTAVPVLRNPSDPLGKEGDLSPAARSLLDTYIPELYNTSQQLNQPQQTQSQQQTKITPTKLKLKIRDDNSRPSTPSTSRISGNNKVKRSVRTNTILEITPSAGAKVRDFPIPSVFRGVAGLDYTLPRVTGYSDFGDVDIDSAVDFLKGFSNAFEFDFHSLLLELLRFTCVHGTSPYVDSSNKLVVVCDTDEPEAFYIPIGDFLAALRRQFIHCSFRQFMGLFADNARMFLRSNPEIRPPSYRLAVLQHRSFSSDKWRELSFDYAADCSGLTSEQYAYVSYLKSLGLVKAPYHQIPSKSLTFSPEE